ncbi:MAG TPA: CHAT domain-containing protein [Blastocatellia bacterium]|nr:CHAT domain-containing protein [Blastocatellia bacterium]HMX28027.1 CHAT domain-containing protein [Blastocatellia bacterium]HNG29538.1 CHAT domain-containing protein [Blastocatellia bacterium]
MYPSSKASLLVFIVSLFACFLIAPSSIAQKRQASRIATAKIQASDVSEIGELTQHLIAANSVAELQSLIAESRHLVTPSLIEALIKLNAINPGLNKKPGKAEALDRLILGLSQQINHQKGIAVAVSYLGLVHRKADQLELALKYYEHSLPLFHPSTEKFWLARVHRYMGMVYYIQQNYPEAMHHFTEENNLVKTEESYYRALALFNLGTSYEELEQFQKANEIYEKSLNISSAITTPPADVDLPGLIADTLFRAGRSHAANWQFDDAILKYQNAADQYAKIKSLDNAASSRRRVVFTYLSKATQKGDGTTDGEALSAAREVLSKIRAESSGSEDYLTALVESAGKNSSQALKSISPARNKVESSLAGKKTLTAEETARLRNLYRAEGIVNYAAGNLPQARAAFDRAIKIIEEQRARIPVNSESEPVSLGYQYSPYGWITAVLVSQGEVEEALHYAERSKGRFLYNLLGDPTGKDYRLSAQAIVEERQKLVNQYFNLDLQLAREQFSASPDNQKIAALTSELEKTKASLVAMRAKLDSNTEEIAKRWMQESRLTAQDLADLLPNEQTALLQFAMSEEQAFLFAVTKTAGKVNLRVYPLGIRKQQIRDGVEKFRNQIVNLHQADDLDLAAREWHAKLLGKAQEQLKNITSLVIVPDGPLWEMPFQALKTQDNRYLIESQAISYAPSFGILRKMSQPTTRAAAELKLLAFGNPSLSLKKNPQTPGALMDESLKPLLHAEKQVAQISKHYDPRSSKVFIRGSATEDNFKTLAPKYEILHLAAHGLYDDLDPMRSSIVLSQIQKDSKEDGILEARELAKLNLSANLAILSACETGRGQVRDGEGVIGLPYSLLVAGCPTTIVSQWKVGDRSTANLMIALHDKLNQTSPQLSKAEAMRQAALTLIKGSNTDYRHPAYWAGFIVFGKAD